MKRKLLLPTSVLMVALISSASAAVRTKALTGTDLADIGSWDALPTTSDIATWSGSSLGGPLTLSSIQTWGAIDIEGATSPLSLSGSALTLSGGQTINGQANSGIYINTAGQDATIANNIALGAGQIWTAQSGRTLTVNGVISGAQTLGFYGGGNFVLGGVNTNSGNITVDASTVTVNSGASLFCASLGWAKKSLTIQNGGTVVANSWSSGNGNFWGECGDDATNPNLYLNNGTFRVKNTNASTSNRLIRIGTGGGTIAVDSGATFDDTTTAAPIQFDGTLTKNGAGELKVSNINMNRNTSTTQGLTVSAGTLTVNGSFLTGNTSTAGTSRDATITQTGGAININATTSGSGEFAPANWGGTTTMNLSGGTLTASTYWGPNVTQRGTGNLNISGTAVVTFAYSGGLTLAGQSGSTGNINLNGGTLNVKALGKGSGTGNFYFNGGTLKAGAASTTFMQGLSTAKVKVGGAVIDTNNFDITIGQSLVEDGTSTGGGLTKSGAGTLTLTGGNSYTGTTTVNAGTLALSGGNAIANTGAVTVTGGTLQLDSSETIGSLSGTGGTVALGANTLTISGSANTNFDGAVTGSGQITQSGGGSLTLTGNSSSYTGGSLVSAGTLLVTGSLGGNVTVASSATVGGTGTIGGNLSLASDSVFDIFLAINDPLAVGGTVTFGAGTPGLRFGINNLISNGVAVDWSLIADNTYTLITGAVDTTNLDNLGLINAADIGGGRKAYLQQGSLQLVVIPEPGAVLLGGLGILALLRRRRA